MEAIDHKVLGFCSREMFHFPNFINVEVFSGRCPCKCVHCPVGVTPPAARKEQFGERKISLKLFQKIVDEVAAYPHSTLRIHSVGEPLLWKELGEALKMSKACQVRTWLFTSGVTSDWPLLESICKYTDIVEVSVNSTNAEDYEATKGVYAFARVVENIKQMSAFIRRKHLSTRLIVSRVQSMDKTKDDAFVHYWQSTGLVKDAFVRTYHTYNDLMGELGAQEPKLEKHEPCLVHWGRFNISAEGYVIVCFNELFKEKLDPSLIFGDVNGQSIAEVWQGSKLTALRKAELSNDYSGLSFADALPCRNCTSCQPLFGNRETSEHQVKGGNKMAH